MLISQNIWTLSPRHGLPTEEPWLPPDLVQEAENFTLGQPTTAYTLPAMTHVLSFLEQKGKYWLTSGRLGKCQVILLDNPKVTLKVVSILNPPTLLLVSTEESIYDCIQRAEEAHSSCLDLTDIPL